MYNLFIQNYVKKLTKNDIISFCNKESIKLTEEELNIIYLYIKNYWKEFLKNDPSVIFNELKSKLNTNTYNKMINLYNKYKEYKNFL